MAVDAEPEGGARSWRAFHADLAAHQFDQVFANHQTEARSAIDAGRCRVALRKGLEQIGQFLLRDADAAVGHAEPEGVLIFGLRLARREGPLRPGW